MATRPFSIQFTQEVEATTIGDQAPTPATNSLEIFANQNGRFYKKTSAGVVTSLIPGVDSVAGLTGAIAQGNTVVASNNVVTNGIEFANPFASRLTGASKTFTAADRGKYYEMINGGAAMTAVLPTLTAADNGYQLGVHNKGTTTAETISFTGAGGEVIGDSATTYVLQFACRQTFLWTGTKWLFGAGNGNLIKSPVGGVTSGNVVKFSDTVGRQSSDSGFPAALATTSTPGFMSSADKTTLGNFWYDVTNYGVSISNSGAANVAAMNTLIQTTAPAGAVFYFPNTGANYPMTGTITITKNYQQFWGAGMRASVIFGANTTQDLFFLTDGVRNITFQDLGFWSTTTATAGAVINCGTVSGSGNAQVNIYRCGMEGFGGNWFNGVMYNGTLAGLLCNLEDCNFNSFTGYGIGIVGNTSIPSTVSANIISNTTLNGNINGSTGALAGIFVRQCGALQIVNSDVIQCTNNLLVAPAASGEIIASIYSNNSYFDSSYGSCVKIAGSGPTVRCKFVSCSFTVSGGANNYSAFEINSTAANAPAGIDLLNCNIQNTFGNSGTSNGLLLTTVADIKIEGNNISGFTNGIQVTPVAGAVTRLNIVGNTIGPAGGIKGNTVGILLNAGATAYGMIQIVDNVFPATTPYGAANGTNITDNSSMGTGTAAVNQKTIANNNGTIITVPTANYGTVLPATTVTSADSRGGVFIPAGARPSSGRTTLYLTNTATIQTLAFTVKFGTNNSNADTTIYTPFTFVAGTAVVGSGIIVIDWELTSATTIIMSARFTNGNNAATGIAATASTQVAQSAPVTISTAANGWIGFYLSSTVNAIVTVRSVKYEVQSQ